LPEVPAWGFILHARAAKCIARAPRYPVGRARIGM
jgi:hypothetical protein